MKKTILIAFLFCPLFLHSQTQLTLAQCLDSAHLHNISLQNAALAIQANQLTQEQAHTKYYPTVAANLLAFRTFDKLVKGDGTIPAEVAAISPALAAYAGQPYAIREFNGAYSASISIMQPVYTGGQIHTANRLAALQTDVSQLQQQLTQRTLDQKIIENYWQIASIKYNLSTLDAAQRQVDSVYTQVELFLKAGIVNANDLLKVKLRQQELALNRVKLTNAEHVLLLLLAQQIGLADQDIDIIAEDQAPYYPPMGDSITPPSRGLAPAWELRGASIVNRTEYSLAQKNLQAATLQLRMERSKLMPTVAVGLMGYGTRLTGLSDATRSLTDATKFNAMLMATVSIPISDWWGGSKAIKRRKIELQSAQLTLDETRQQLHIDIEAAWTTLLNAHKQVDIASTTVQQAAENLRISSLQYKAGTETITNLLDAETLNRQALNSLNNAIAEYQSALAVYRLKTR